MSDKAIDSDYPLGPPLEFLRRIWRLNHALERASRRMDKELGLTAQQRFMLRCIGRFPGITPGDVARVLHLNPGTVSSTVRRLENKGLVRRRKDAADTRRTTLGLTHKGRELDVPAAETVEAAVEALLGNTSPGDVEVAVSVVDQLASLLGEST